MCGGKAVGVLDSFFKDRHQSELSRMIPSILQPPLVKDCFFMYTNARKSSYRYMN